MISCPHCQSKAGSEPYLRCGDRFVDPDSDDFQLVRCTGCGLIYLDPRPAPEAGIYREEGYDPFLSLKKPQSFFERIYASARRWTLAWKRRLVRKISAESDKPLLHILDIGCGTGEFLSVLADDYYVEGIEPEPEAARWARERLGLNVHTGTLQSAKLDRQSYDLISLWHVLEHVPDPLEELNRLHQLLTPTGRLLIALPNISSMDAAVYKSYWVALDAPRHLWHFSPDSLEHLTSKVGFRRIKSGMLPLDTFYNVLLSEQLYLKTHSRAQLLIAPFRMKIAIIRSLISGALNGRHSGMFYVFEKV